MSPAVAQPRSAQADPRVAAFCSRSGPEVFSGIVHGTQIWSPDPFDVESIHAEARDAFARLVNRASVPDLPPHGKTLLLLGDSGSGKTHLLRAFRSYVHSRGVGYCGYMQMTSRSDNYARYVLSNVMDSLEQPYKPGSQETGLTRLARGLLDSLDIIPAEDRQRLCEDILEPDDTARLVHRLADMAVQYPRFRQVDIDLIRAMLFTLPNDARVRTRILKWLRCEDLGKYDRELIGDLAPRPQPEMPLRTLIGLGRLAHAVHTAAFVFLVDQIEEVLDLDRKDEEKGEVLRRMVNTLVDIMDGVPNAVVVTGCLGELFEVGRPLLPMPKLDRLERDPEPRRLTAKRTAGEVADLVARRLEVLFDAAGAEPDPTNPVAPYFPGQLNGLVGNRTRDVLDAVRMHREVCCSAGTWVEPKWPDSQPGSKKIIGWEPQWNDFLAAYKTPILDEPALAELLADTIRTISVEMPNGIHFGADPDGRFIPVEVHGPDNGVDRLLVAVCDRTTRGGALGKQVEEVAKKAGEITAVLVRSTDFPTDQKQKVTKEITALVAPRGKGRKVAVRDSDWRAMAAFREFHRKYHAEPGFAEWQKADRPLGKLRAVHAILALDNLLAVQPAKPASPPPPAPPAGLPKEVTAAQPPSAPPAPAPSAAGPVRLGQTRGAVPARVDLKPKDLCRHAAFLGGPGSGKTTAALAIVEQLLRAGVPAVLLDRKGDLSRYADPDAWTAAEPDADRAARRAELREAIDVALFTPGSENGRPLAIPVVPGDLAQLPAADREQVAEYAANGLGTMMGLKGKGADAKLVILQRAIAVLAAVPGQEVTVRLLQELVKGQDDALVSALDGLDGKHFKDLAQDLLVLAHKRGRMFSAGEALDVDALLGRGPTAAAGKTRLTVVNTQFLGDASTTDFWVSQFLLAVDRWRAKNPAPDGALQAVFLFDEADQYLPAVRQPATKGPMESLLKRARSAGVGLFLATQSPGDFDYRCRDQVLTWLVGRVKESVAINKLKPMLEAKPGAVDKLADQTVGQFYLVRESDVSPISVDQNAITTSQLPEDRILALARAGAKPR